MFTRRKKRPAKKKPSAKKKRKPAKTRVKAKAKRQTKALVKALAPARRTKRQTPRKTKLKQRVKLVRRKLSNEEELQVNALIARVYQKAAAEMRRLEEAANSAQSDMMHHAAEEIVRLEGVAKKFKNEPKSK